MSSSATTSSSSSSSLRPPTTGRKMSDMSLPPPTASIMPFLVAPTSTTTKTAAGAGSSTSRLAALRMELLLRSTTGDRTVPNTTPLFPVMTRTAGGTGGILKKKPIRDQATVETASTTADDYDDDDDEDEVHDETTARARNSVDAISQSRSSSSGVADRARQYLLTGMNFVDKTTSELRDPPPSRHDDDDDHNIDDDDDDDEWSIGTTDSIEFSKAKYGHAGIPSTISWTSAVQQQQQQSATEGTTPYRGSGMSYDYVVPLAGVDDDEDDEGNDHTDEERAPSKAQSDQVSGGLPPRPTSSSSCSQGQQRQEQKQQSQGPSRESMQFYDAYLAARLSQAEFTASMTKQSPGIKGGGGSSGSGGEIPMTKAAADVSVAAMPSEDQKESGGGGYATAPLPMESRRPGAQRRPSMAKTA